MGFFDGLLNLAGTYMTNEANKDIANSANQFSAHQFANRYQTTVKDMQAAGLNPMLAYSQGGGSPPTAQVGHPQQSVIGSALEGYHKSKEREMIDAQIDLLKNQSTKANQEMLESLARTNGIDLDNTVKQLYSVDKARQETLNLGSTADEIQSRIGLNNAQKAQFEKNIDVLIQNINTGKATEQQSKEMVNQIRAYTDNLKLDRSEKEAMAKMWKDLGEGGAAAKTFVPFLQLLKSILGK
jgi:excinuclease UvrABC ATPase subunit